MCKILFPLYLGTCHSFHQSKSIVGLRNMFCGAHIYCQQFKADSAGLRLSGTSGMAQAEV